VRVVPNSHPVCLTLGSEESRKPKPHQIRKHTSEVNGVLKMPELPEEPINREPSLDHLIKSFITKSEGYDRNHGAFPSLDSSTHRVLVAGAVNQPLSLSISDLANDFPQHTVTCALQCAGNRRHTMRTQLQEVQGIDWRDGAVMNCKWSGPRLSDILHRAGISLPTSTSHSDTQARTESMHVAFACNTQPCQESDWYGSSIPLSRALRPDADVILALTMNDAPLPLAHGSPVRLMTPGIAGARAVKWLDCITVQDHESQNHYMQRDYKVLPPEAVDSESAERFWGEVEPVQEMPVNSAIAVPREGSTVSRNSDGVIMIEGYALPSGEGGPIVEVEVRLSDDGDGGAEGWTRAELLHFEDDSKWSWKLWRAKLKVPDSGTAARSIHSRATDAAGNTQPRHSQWNLRGVCYNGYGEVADITVK